MEVVALVLAWAVAVGRALTGVWFLAKPRQVADSWLGATGLPVSYLVRSVGGRDLMIGLGLAAALLADRSAVPWVIASVGGDAVDAGAAMAMLSGEPRRRSLLFAGGFGLLGVATAVLLAT